MENDNDKIDDAVLALMCLTLLDVSEFGARSWKSFDWESLNRLHVKGMIGNPVSKAKSVVVTQAGVKKSKELFEKLFSKQA